MNRHYRTLGPLGRGDGGIRLRSVRYPAGKLQPPHSHPRTSVTLHLAGAIRERSGREEIESSGLSLTIKPAGVIHSDRFGPDPVSTFQIELDPEFDAVADGWSRGLERWRWIRGGPSVRAGFEVLRAVRDDEPEDAVREQLIALLDVLTDAAPEPRDSCPPAWLGHALDLLECRFASGVRVSEIAAEVGVHPVHLTRCFRTWRGCTVSEYLRRLQVREAARLLAATRRPVARIAFASGFADQSHLTRTFKRETGVTPARYRRLAS